MALTGSYYLLSITPWFVVACSLYLLTIGVIWYLRDRFEGFAYNTAFSSQFGDVALLGIAFIGVEIIKQGGQVPWCLNSTGSQIVVALASFAVGLNWWRVDRPKEWGDCYHHLVVAPLFSYLLATLVPVIWIAGTPVGIYSACSLGVLWAILLSVDYKRNRLDQRRWLARRGIKLLLK